MSMQSVNEHQAETQEESLLYEETAISIVLPRLDQRLPGESMSSGCSHGSLGHEGNLPQTDT